MKWIKVTHQDDLPLDGTMFLATFELMGEYHVGTATYDKETMTLKCKFTAKVDYDSVGHATIESIKFWQPLPEPPLKSSVYLSYE